MSRFCFVIVCIVFSITASAQSTMSISDNGVMRLNRNGSDEDLKLSLKRGSFVGDHILGDSVAMLLNKFEQIAIYYTKTDGAYAQEREVIIKPAIYKKVKTLDKFFIKEATKKTIPLWEAKKREMQILIIGRKLYRFDTSGVEKDLKNIKEPAAIEDYLLKLKFND